MIKLEDFITIETEHPPLDTKVLVLVEKSKRYFDGRADKKYHEIFTAHYHLTGNEKIISMVGHQFGFDVGKVLGWQLLPTVLLTEPTD